MKAVIEFRVTDCRFKIKDSELEDGKTRIQKLKFVQIPMDGPQGKAGLRD